MQDITLEVEITGSVFGWFEWRRHVAMLCLRLAAAVLRMGIEVKM